MVPATLFIIMTKQLKSKWPTLDKRGMTHTIKGLPRKRETNILTLAGAGGNSGGRQERQMKVMGNFHDEKAYLARCLYQGTM